MSVAETLSAGNTGPGGAAALPEDDVAAEYAAEYREWYRLFNKGQTQDDVSSSNGLAEAAVDDEQLMSEDFQSTCYMDFDNAQQIGLQHQQHMEELDAAAEASLAAAVAAVTVAAAAGDTVAAAVLNGAVDVYDEAAQQGLTAVLDEVRELLMQGQKAGSAMSPAQQQRRQQQQ